MKKTIKKACLVGAGSWGTSIAIALAENNPDTEVVMWAYEKKVVKEINNKNENITFLPGIPLPINITATNNLKTCISKSEIIIFATPSKVLFEIAGKTSSIIDKNAIIGYLSKGFSKIHGEIFTISQTLDIAIPEHKGLTVAISGPSHAEEVSTKFNTCLNIGSYSKDNRAVISSLLQNDSLECRELEDILGVDIGGTLKNPAAIAAGMISILPNCGDNLAGALISEALKEMLELSSLYKVKPETIIDVSGLGDLVATALSDHSRNRRFGIDISRQLLSKRALLSIKDKMILKFKPEYVIEKMSKDLHYLAEGAYAIEPIIELAERHNISIPVYRSLYEVLLNKKDPSLLIETIKNPHKFEDIYKNTKIQINERKKGLETIKGTLFKKKIIEKSNAKILSPDTKNSFYDSNFIINNLKEYLEQNKDSKRVSIRESFAIKYIQPKNFDKTINLLTHKYTNKLVDTYNVHFKNWFMRYLKLCDYEAQIFNKKSKINITGQLNSIKMINNTIHIVYVPKFTNIHDFLYIIYAINKLNFPFPRFYVSKDIITSKWNKYLLKKLGGFTVDENKISNIVYREVLSEYLATMIDNGVPLLYFPDIDEQDNSDISKNFFSIITEEMYKHTIEIALIPIEISYKPEDLNNGKSNLSFRKQMGISPIIHFSEPLFLSDFTKNNTLIDLPEIVKNVWKNDLSNIGIKT